MVAIASNSIRAFIAIELPKTLKTMLSALQQDIRKSVPSGIRWVEANNIHLTLKFLAEISDATKLRIIDKLHGICPSLIPFTLRMETLGAFPNTRHPRNRWLGLNGDIEALLLLQKTIDSALIPLGFVTEKRPFEPHLTLARVKEGAAASVQRSLSETITKTGWNRADAWPVSSVALMRSTLLPSGPEYHRIAEIRLGNHEQPFSAGGV